MSAGIARPPAWFWAALALGAGARVFLVLFTQGTDDVRIWETHAGWMARHGIVAYYEHSQVFNHPPFVAWLMQGLWRLAQVQDLPFLIPLRTLTAVVDAGNALLLLALLRDDPRRWLAAACYWLHPLALVFSAYHGNTDSAVPLFMLLSLWALSRGSALAAGAALGVGLWIKLPVALAAPALLLSLPDGRQRLRFAAALGVVGASTYLPVALAAPESLFERVFSYAGRPISTPDGTPIWGLWSLLGPEASLPAPLAWLSRTHLAWNSWVCGVPILVLAWLRRERRETREIGTTLCASVCIVFGLTHSPWAFQYAAWIAPLLFFPGWRFAALATLALGGYVYGVYAFLTGSPLLVGAWDFGRTPGWPVWLVAWRSAAVLFFAASAGFFLGEAARRSLGEARPGA